MKTTSLIIALAAVALSGCATQMQLVKGYESAAAISLRAAEDNQLGVLTFGLCATPYSAIVRHPEIVPGVMALCLPGGNLSNPANLLSAIPAKP